MADDPSRGALAGAEEEDETIQPWVVTFADMITLLMCFFALLFSVSSVDETRFESIVHSVQGALSGSSGGGGPTAAVLQGTYETSAPYKQKGLDPFAILEDQGLVEDAREMVSRQQVDDALEVIMEGRKVILRVKGQALFASGSAVISPEAVSLVDQIAKLVREYPTYRLDIKGHTDPRPISTAKFDSNWELSALRATAVLRFLADRGVSPRRMTATGYADTQPLVPNSSEENMAKNRRVEFVLEKKEK
jgi:chemotaxis protein MotB